MASYSDYSNQGHSQFFFEVGAYRIKDDVGYDQSRGQQVHVLTIDEGQDTRKVHIILTDSGLEKVMKMTDEERATFCENVVKAIKVSKNHGKDKPSFNEIQFTGKKTFKLIKSQQPVFFQKRFGTVSQSETSSEMKEKTPTIQRYLDNGQRLIAERLELDDRFDVIANELGQIQQLRCLVNDPQSAQTKFSEEDKKIIQSLILVTVESFKKSTKEYPGHEELRKLLRSASDLLTQTGFSISIGAPPISATATKENRPEVNVEGSLQQLSSSQDTVRSEEIGTIVFGEPSEPAAEISIALSGDSLAFSVLSIKNEIEAICKSIDYFQDIHRETADIRFESLKTQLLKLLEEIENHPPQQNGVDDLILDKLERFHTFVNEHFKAEEEGDGGQAVDLWAQDFQKLAKELHGISGEGFSLGEVEDELWLEKLGAEYAVDYTTFYDHLILELFPEMKGNKDFQEFVSDYLINPLKGAKITPYSWREFVKIFGPLGELRENILKLYENPSFVGLMSREESQRHLLRFHREHRGTPTKSLIRFSVNSPGAFILSYSRPVGVQKQRALHHVAYSELARVLRAQFLLEGSQELYPFRDQAKSGPII